MTAMARTLTGTLIALLTLVTSSTWAQNVSIPNTFQPNTTAVADEVNENFSAVADAINQTALSFGTDELKVGPNGFMRIQEGTDDLAVHLNGHFAFGALTERCIPPCVPFFSDVTMSLVPHPGEVPFFISDSEGGSGIMYVDGDGNIFKSGSVSFVVDHPEDDTKRIVYVSLEGPEAGTYIRGTASLVDGRAEITLPEHFSLVTNEEGLSVQLTPVGQWLQLFVVEQDTHKLVVGEAGGKGGVFHYLVQGTRVGYEKHQAMQDKKGGEYAMGK